MPRFPLSNCTVYTGYMKTWSGKTSFTTGYVPPGGYGEFDVLTCRDKVTGEIQRFDDYPDAPDSDYDSYVTDSNVVDEADASRREEEYR
jgi:hypothetical protein